MPRGNLQVENGSLETTSSGQRGFDFPETLLRLGIADEAELRFTVPDYFQNITSGTGFGSGWGDLAAGIKQQLGPVHGFDLL